MNPLPATNLRGNLGTWAVPGCQVPAVAGMMLATYPAEPFDPGFRGQRLGTTYFDTAKLHLRHARRQGTRYLTLRMRHYQPSGAFAFSAKTENEKIRVDVSADLARLLLASDFSTATPWEAVLPGHLLARLTELAADQPLGGVVLCQATRFATENGQDRLTLDVDVSTDTGRCLPAGVLEFKSTNRDDPLPGALLDLGLRPIKFSKFLWATDWR